MTAMGSFVSLPWSNQQAFEDSVLRVVEKSVVAGQHLRTTVVKSATVDGRPCVDIFRAGNVDSMTAPNGASTGPLMTREHVRACHLRDARGPEAVVVEVFQEISAHDPLGFDAVANPFIDGMQLPPWMH